MKGNLQEIATARTPSQSSSPSKKRGAFLLPNYCLLPNVLAVDAAIFAAYWQVMVIQAFDLETSWQRATLLAMAVWLGYAADRWLDVIGMKNNPRTLRHKFAAQHCKSMLLAWAITITGSVIAACNILSTKELLAGFILAGLCICNAWLNHLDSKGHSPVPKELRAALLLASGIHLFLWTQLQETSFPFWSSFTAVTVMCFLNCCLVAKWETRADLEQGQSSFALRHKRFKGNASAFTLSIATLCSAIALLRTHDPDGLILQATTVALLALLILDRSNLAPEDKRALADASLFLPCLLLVP